MWVGLTGLREAKVSDPETRNKVIFTKCNHSYLYVILDYMQCDNTNSYKTSGCISGKSREICPPLLPERLCVLFGMYRGVFANWVKRSTAEAHHSVELQINDYKPNTTVYKSALLSYSCSVFLTYWSQHL
jgi:hypothetical protein